MTAHKTLIVVVDDDANVTDAVTAALSEEGFEVKSASSLLQGRGLIERLSPDLVILDRRLPDGDGLDLCRRLREDPRWRSLPILFLSSKSGVSEKVVGLTIGADDYLAKPFKIEELLARIRALLRRTQPAAESGLVRSGDLAVDVETRKATNKGKPVDLTPKEFDLLHAFLKSRGRVLTRTFLLETVWGYDPGTELDTRVVDSTVSHLRAKLGSAGKRLVSVLNHGYQLEDQA